MSGGTRMTSIRKRLTLVGASTPILSFGRKLKSISSAASRTYQSRDLHNVTKLRLRYEIRLAVDKRSTANRATKSTRPRTQYFASAQLLVFKDESSRSTATSLTWGGTS